MALPQDINDRHYGKYRDTTSGIAVAVINPDGTQISNALPTSGNNPSTALSYDVDGNLQYIDETIGSTTYRTTLTYSAGVLVGVSEAVEL